MAARTVGEAFRQFAVRNTPTPTQRETMSGRRARVHAVLRLAFAQSNMPLVKTKLIGSAGRNTIIRPIEDVDVLAVFDDSVVWHEYQFDARKLLYRVRAALNRNYSVTVGSRSQAVRLSFENKPHVEIVPAFAVDTGGYCIASGKTNLFFGTGTWQMTDPYFHETFLSRRHAELGNRLKPLTRLIKRWNAVHGHHFASFHLELLVQARSRRSGRATRSTPISSSGGRRNVSTSTTPPAMAAT